MKDGGDLSQNAAAPENRPLVARVDSGHNKVWERYQGDAMETLDLRNNRTFRVVTYTGYVSTQALKDGTPTGDIQDISYDDFDPIVYVRHNPQFDVWWIGRLSAVRLAAQDKSH